MHTIRRYPMVTVKNGRFILYSSEQNCSMIPCKQLMTHRIWLITNYFIWRGNAQPYSVLKRQRSIYSRYNITDGYIIQMMESIKKQLTRLDARMAKVMPKVRYNYELRKEMLSETFVKNRNIPDRFLDVNRDVVNLSKTVNYLYKEYDGGDRSPVASETEAYVSLDLADYWKNKPVPEQ